MQLTPNNKKRFEAVGIVSSGSLCRRIFRWLKGNEDAFKKEELTGHFQNGLFCDVRKHLDQIKNYTGVEPPL